MADWKMFKLTNENPVFISQEFTLTFSLSQAKKWGLFSQSEAIEYNIFMIRGSMISKSKPGNIIFSLRIINNETIIISI
jgi:hypothetical protein